MCLLALLLLSLLTVGVISALCSPSGFRFVGRTVQVHFVSGDRARDPAFVPGLRHYHLSDARVPTDIWTARVADFCIVVYSW